MGNVPGEWNEQQARLQHQGHDIPNESTGWTAGGWPASQHYDQRDPRDLSQQYSYPNPEAFSNELQYGRSYQEEPGQTGPNYSTYNSASSSYKYPKMNQNYPTSQEQHAYSGQKNEGGGSSSYTLADNSGQPTWGTASYAHTPESSSYQQQQGYFQHLQNHDQSSQSYPQTQGYAQFPNHQRQQGNLTLRSGTPHLPNLANPSQSRMNPQATSYRPDRPQPKGTPYQPSLSTLPEGAIQGDISTGRSEPLDKSYRMRDSQFFHFGRIFSMLYTEACSKDTNDYGTDRDANERKKEDDNVSVVKYGEHVYSNIRRFVVIEERRGFCYAFPVSTYGGRACTKPGVKSNEHAIIYTGENPPKPKHDEAPMLDSIRVYTDKPEVRLHKFSRLNCGMRIPVQHNVKVKNLGTVDADSLPSLAAFRDMELFGDFPVQEPEAYRQQARPLDQDTSGLVSPRRPVAAGKNQERLALTHTEHNKSHRQRQSIYDNDDDEDDVNESAEADENTKIRDKGLRYTNPSVSRDVNAGTTVSRVEKYPERPKRQERSEYEQYIGNQSSHGSKYDDLSASHSLPIRGKTSRDIPRKQFGSADHHKGSGKYKDSRSSRSFQ